MRKFPIFFFVTFGIGVILWGGWWALKYLGISSSQPVKVFSPERTSISETDEQTDRTGFISLASEQLQVELVAGGLEVPWSIVFTSTERMLITERPGRIRAVVNGELVIEPLLVIDEVLAGGGEIGLMGMVAHPDYEENQTLFACYGYRAAAQTIYNKVVTLIDHQDTIQLGETIIDELPSAQNHAGCELGISPDQKLFITVGDALDRGLAQDMGSLAGKILRLNLDGSIPDDNPFPNSPIFTFGHRNPQGLAWHPGSGALYSTEHGPSLFDGPAGGDEVNLLKPGQNYGWPLISHDQTAPNMQRGLVVYTPAVAPATATFYTGEEVPELQGSLLFGGLRGEGLFRVLPDPDQPDIILGHEKLNIGELGRIRVVATDLSGTLYIGTSNRDGRGITGNNDDAIYKVVGWQ